MGCSLRFPGGQHMTVRCQPSPLGCGWGVRFPFRLGDPGAAFYPSHRWAQGGLVIVSVMSESTQCPYHTVGGVFFWVQVTASWHSFTTSFHFQCPIWENSILHPLVEVCSSFTNLWTAWLNPEFSSFFLSVWTTSFLDILITLSWFSISYVFVWLASYSTRVTSVGIQGLNGPDFIERVMGGCWQRTWVLGWPRADCQENYANNILDSPSFSINTPPVNQWVTTF